MIEEHLRELTRTIEIDLGENRQFMLIVIEKGPTGKIIFNCAGNVSKGNTPHLIRCIDEDLKPQLLKP